MDILDQLENDAVYIIRHAYREFKRPALLWSMGKDSTVLLWLVRKAFFGSIPFPVIHIDTERKFPEMIAFRNSLAEEWNLNLIIGKNQRALYQGMGPEQGRLICCNALKTQALHDVILKHHFQGLFVGIRGDEEGTRNKERIFSPRGKNSEWNVQNQPPEFWHYFQTRIQEGQHLRIHPLLTWTELQVWQYIQRENIPLLDLYFSKEGKRYRTLGCECCTSPCPSNASNLEDLIREIQLSKTSERALRAQDQADDYAMEKLRVQGYM